MTIWEFANLHQNGEIDIDVCDKEIDMVVAFTYDTKTEPKDNYDRFMELLARNVQVDWWREDMLCCDFSGFYRNHREALVKLSRENEWSLDEEEIEYDAAEVTAAWIAGYSDEHTYGVLLDALAGDCVAKVQTVTRRL